MIDWNLVQFFTPSEFPDDTELVSPELIYNLDSFRKILQRKIYPSPVKGALVRTDINASSSQHYADKEKGKLSKAVDVFCEGFSFHAYTEALSSQLFGGIGVYFNGNFDGKKWVRFHFDTRALGEKHSKRTALIWYVNENGQRYYPQYNPTKYKEMLDLFLKYNIFFKKGEKYANT